MGIPNYQEILDLLKNGLMLEAREKILELREAALKLQEENLSLKEKLKQAHGASDLCSQMYFDKGAYWVLTGCVPRPRTALTSWDPTAMFAATGTRSQCGSIGTTRRGAAISAPCAGTSSSGEEMAKLP